MLKLLPFLIGPGVAGAVVYWLTRSRTAALAAGAVVLAAMLVIGITS